MKMLISILNPDDSSTVIHNLMKEGYSVTKLSTTGGFLRSGNVTILMGLEEEQVQNAIDIISKHSKSRKQVIPAASDIGLNFYPTMPVEVLVGGATIFVLNVEHFEKV